MAAGDSEFQPIAAPSTDVGGSLPHMLGEQMQREISEQPELLARLAPEYAERAGKILRGLEFDLVLLVARGSSDNAALYARYLIEIHVGIPVVLAAPSVLTRYKARVRYPRTLAIGISQSGAAPDVSEVIAAMREVGHTTLAITNTPDSRLAHEAEHTFDLEAGEERSVAATKTYSASLLALYQITRAMGADLRASETPSADWSERCRKAAQSHVAAVLDSEPVFCLGRGYEFATAQETALKLMECALIPCRAYSTADFEHGPKALADEGSAIIAYGQVNPALEAQGGIVLPAPIPSVPEEVQPIWQILYGQWLALECARARGEDPDEPRFLRKVTRTR